MNSNQGFWNSIKRNLNSISKFEFKENILTSFRISKFDLAQEMNCALSW
jgi:hypothetical protein